MDHLLLFIIIGCAAFVGLLVLVFLMVWMNYQRRIRSLYQNEARDERFAGALLSQIFGDRVLLNPYVLRDDETCPPRVDAILVCAGGVAVISVQKGGGLYSVPEQGAWRVIDRGEMRTIDNLLERQQRYISEISATLLKHSLRSPAIHGYVFLTDDLAEVDYTGSPRVLGGSRLIGELKSFDAARRLTKKEQKAILAALAKTARNIEQTFEYRSGREDAVDDPDAAHSRASDPAEDDIEFDLSELLRRAEEESDGDA